MRTDIKTTYLGGTVMARVRHPKPLPVPVCQAPQVSYLCKTLLHIYCMLIWLPLAPPRARASMGCLTLRRIEPPLLAAILGPQPSAMPTRRIYIYNTATNMFPLRTYDQ